jgi:DNA (cytosine-5)-methyltransferase 1
MFSESRRFIVDDMSLIHSQIDLKAVGKQFLSAGNAWELSSCVTLQFEGEGHRTINHDLVSPGGRVRWIVKDDAISEFYSGAGLTAGDEIIIQRVAPNIFRLSPCWRPFTFIDLFAGIGGMRIAFESVRGNCVFSSEYDSLAQDTYEANFGERPSGDITEIPECNIPEHDILLAGFPCQPFSIIGNREGFADTTRGTLFFHIERILREKRPHAVLLENVKQFRTHDHGRTCKTVLRSLEGLGYHTHITVANALDYGVAQKRERTFIVAFQDDIEFSFPKPFGWRPGLETVYEADDQVDPKLIASEMIQKKRLERIRKQGREPFYPSMWHENKGGHIGMHPFSCALRHNASYNYLLVNGMRRATGREMLRLQGYPETFRIVVKHSAIRAQCGNSVAVPTITAIAAQMMRSLRLSIPSGTLSGEKQGSLFAATGLSCEGVALEAS